MHSKDMEYLMSTPHWLNAITPPLQKHVNMLINTKKFFTWRRFRSGFDTPY
jgi:hypothetical protein